MCSVVDVGAKRFCVVCPKGRGFPGGWETLAAKLRSLGVVTKGEATFEV